MIVGPEGTVYGSSGGGHLTTTIEAAREKGASVKAHALAQYNAMRGDLRGYRRLLAFD
jgi:hypothetical protein